jgi:hypothetical protein
MAAMDRHGRHGRDLSIVATTYAQIANRALAI